MKPLDIRIVQLIESLNQAGIDPAQSKQLIEGLLAPGKVTDKQEWKVGDSASDPKQFKEDSSELTEDVPDDERWYIGDRVWFWDPKGKRILKGTIHRLDHDAPGAIAMIQQHEGLHPRWASCEIENLHRDEGNLIAEHKNTGTSVVWDSVFWGRCSGTIVGYLKNPEEGSRAIIVEDDRQHAEWDQDKYRLHFVSFLDYQRSGATYPLD